MSALRVRLSNNSEFGFGFGFKYLDFVTLAAPAAFLNYPKHSFLVLFFFCPVFSGIMFT